MTALGSIREGMSTASLFCKRHRTKAKKVSHAIGVMRVRRVVEVVQHRLPERCTRGCRWVAWIRIQH